MSNQSAKEAVYNQSPPYCGYNLAESDQLLLSLGDTYGGADSQRGALLKFGAQCGGADALVLGRLANTNRPELRTHDPYGRRLDLVEYHPSYHALMRRSFEAGLHCAFVEAKGRPGKPVFVERAQLYYVMTQVEAGHLCPVTMTNAAGFALSKQPDIAGPWLEKIGRRKYDQRFRAASGKDGVSIGMGMTERQGGTDLRQIVTSAALASDGHYRLTGHKWFMSAPMSDAFLVLATLQEGPSCFLVPRVLDDGAVNRLNFQRLKDKLGNWSNASSEVEFDEALGYLIGHPGKGIGTILNMVTPTRVDCVLGSSGLMRGAVARAVHHVRHRSVFGHHLIDQPIMQRVLADMALDVAAATALALRLAHAQDGLTRGDEASAEYLRVVTPAAKYWVCKVAATVINEAMESLGGNGYVEDFDLARFYREAPVNSIWEGSGSVMALDMLRVLSKETQSFINVLGEFQQGLGSAGRVSVEVLQAAARSCVDDPGGARILTEQLAITAAGDALKKVAPPAIADAFIETRLAGQWRSSYGMLDGRYNAKEILDWLYRVA
ncbi:DNA alkylation response protein [Rhodobacteraceae bacterium RKSG542]|uniref:acyl-CoA dehydrogenase family protein n=1 Tax=Pseudovibrio flavus TaxID=2529854 RepID=UPI0012BD5DEE|nr:acyl-CoA dehydrogenase family protein [Pseudovibrio flavus]MTI16370.1 DNA alkylation response protein [Pseudovibrio flavus]